MVKKGPSDLRPGDGSDHGKDAQLERRIARALAEFVDRRASGDSVDPEEFVARHPDLSPMLGAALEAAQELGSFVKVGATPDVLGDFQILREIGRGGMGIVYEAWQTSLDRRVALKVLPASLLSDSKAVLRFQREAKVAARLHHENIVEVYGMGIESGLPYFAMEFVEGKTLRQLRSCLSPRSEEMSSDSSDKTETEPLSILSELLRRSEARQESFSDSLERLDLAPSGVAFSGGSFDVDLENLSPSDSGTREMDRSDFKRIAQAFAGVAAGLHYAHTMRVIHRDLKPSNMILDNAGRLRILDFGLARVEGQEQLTVSSECVGTPLYMSPEQVVLSADHLGPGTDIYSLGVTLYEVLTGRPPFQGKNNQQTLNQIVHREPPPPRKLNDRVPRDLETIVLKCLRKSPRERYATAEALGQDLRRWVRGAPIEARPYSPGEKILRYTLRNKGRVAVTLSFFFLLMSLGWLSWRHSQEAFLIKASDYQTKVVGAVMKMAQGFVKRSVSPSKPLSGGYTDGLFIPRQSVSLLPQDYQELIENTKVKTLVEEAASELKEAREMLPERPDAPYHLARGLALLGRDEEALEALTQVPRSQDFVPASLLRAVLLEKRGEVERAKAEMERLRKSALSQWAESWLEAYRATVKEDWKAAAEAYGRIIDGNAGGQEPYLGSSIETLLGRGAARLELNEFAGAIVDFASAKGSWPRSLEPVLLLGKVYLLEGEREEAERTFKEMFDRASLKDQFALGVAEIYSSLEDNEKGLEWTERLKEEHLRERTRAAFLLKLGRWKDALKAAKKAIELRPKDVPSRLWLGLALMVGEEKYAEASEIFLEASRLDPWNPMPRVWLGDALARQGKLMEAFEEYREATRLDPRNPWIYISRGVTLLRKDDVKGAFGEYLRAIELDPKLESIYVHLGDLFQRETPPDISPEIDRFVQVLEKALEEGGDRPLLPDLLRILAESILQDPGRRRLPKALHYASLAVEKTDRSCPRMLHVLAEAQLANGEGAAAVRTLEEAVGLLQATYPMKERLAEYRKALLPDLVSYPSIDAALDSLDEEEIISRGVIWRYLPGKKEPSEGLEWTLPEFDDSSWPSGPSGFGYGDGDDATVLEDMRGSYTTLYVRHDFDVPDPASYGRILVSVRVDDGLVAYLNGTEVARFGAEPDVTRIPFSAVAPRNAIEPLIPIEFFIDARLLRRGKNIFAIQGLNQNVNSSDFSLIPVLKRHVLPDAEKDRNLLKKFRAVAPVDGRGPSLVAYLEGRVLQRRGKFQEAAAKFAELASLDPSEPEPFLQRAENLLAAGRSQEAEAELSRLLSSAFPNDRSLWDLWFVLSFRNRKETPADMLASFPPLPEEVAAGQVVKGSFQPNYAEDVRWVLLQLQKGEGVRINCGGSDYQDSRGRWWGRDRFFHSGKRFGEPVLGLLPLDQLLTFGGDISGTDDDPLYQTERWFPQDHVPAPAGYRVPLVPGTYRVTLHFAEVYFTKLGQRCFDVVLEGEPVLKGYDPFSAGFKTADQKTFTVTVSDGFLDLDLLHRLDSPKISAIEIQPLK